MRSALLILIFTFSISCSSSGQDIWITRNITNIEFEFMMHMDSISNLYEIKSGKFYNGSDSTDLNELIKDYFEFSEFYRGKIKTYFLISPHNQKGLYITLDFVYNRLFQINMFSDNGYYLGNFRYEIERHFKNIKRREGSVISDSVVNKGHTIITYGNRLKNERIYGGNKFMDFLYLNELENGYGYFIMTNKKIMRRIPSWCGTCFQGGTWEKLNKYIIRKTKANK